MSLPSYWHEVSHLIPFICEVTHILEGFSVGLSESAHAENGRLFETEKDD